MSTSYYVRVMVDYIPSGSTVNGYYEILQINPSDGVVTYTGTNNSNSFFNTNHQSMYSLSNSYLNPSAPLNYNIPSTPNPVYIYSDNSDTTWLGKIGALNNWGLYNWTTSPESTFISQLCNYFDANKSGISNWNGTFSPNLNLYLIKWTYYSGATLYYYPLFCVGNDSNYDSIVVV